jgi:hypothetical protein
MTSPRILTLDVYPNFGAVGGSAHLASIIGALLTVILIVAVLTLVGCAITWALASSHGNIQAVHKAKTGVWIAIGSAALAGAGVAWVNSLLHIGSTL